MNISNQLLTILAVLLTIPLSGIVYADELKSKTAGSKAKISIKKNTESNPGKQKVKVRQSMDASPENVKKQESAGEPTKLNSATIAGADGSSKSANNDKTRQQGSIGDAWLEKDGSITLRLRSTSDGQHLDGTFTYKPSDKDYGDVLKHLGGLKPGEIKPVPPWK
jgi:hypothetical protein